jgi:hypothetical protein
MILFEIFVPHVLLFNNSSKSTLREKRMKLAVEL